ncbi:uncharacterized protein LOC124909596 [Impatiens glandulifera]|uniref:uncharacterized protein LOC124909596 n=1 Tax=Impatiens glandulifera TaxID=253017 RepID=UPI001FB13331|nr:uncharacterized protein LOC124909596 [Impatiens glandulifera]
MAWSLKKILKLKNNIGSIFDIRIGDGRGTLFWHDPWFENKPLISRDKFRGLRIRRDCVAATVHDIHSRLWVLTITWVLEGKRVIDHLSGLNLCDKADGHLWKAKENEKIKSSAIWNIIRERGQFVSWASFVWSSKVILRHRFILWLVFRRRLNTRDRILAYMDIPDASCVLCSGSLESINHLFGSCSFAKSIWKLFSLAMGIGSLSESWDEIIISAHTFDKGNKFRANVFKCEFVDIIYHLWAERNARVFGRVHRNVNHVWSDIVFDCGALIKMWRRIPKGGRDWVLCHEWKVNYDEVTSFKCFKVI